MKEMFDAILDKDEEIIKVYKPNKRRFVNLSIIGSIIVLGPLFVFLLTISILAFSGAIEVINDDGSDGAMPMAIMMLVFAVFVFLLSAFVVIVRIVRYKKTFYAFSNKRILIRSGFIGVDFMALEMKLIGATLINVGFLDKFIKPNTGSITFASNSTPMGGTNQNAQRQPGFLHIDNAYETYREIKEVVDSHLR